MNCPKCGTQNPVDVQVCTSCGSELTQPPTPAESVKVETSRLAIASLILGILSIFISYLAAVEKSDIIAIISFGLAISALTFGIISLIRIGLSAGKLTGKGFAVIGIVMPAVFFSVMFLQTVLPRTRCIAFRMVCGSNLSGIGRAMLIYANDYDNSFPRAGGPTSKWGTTLDWQADNRFDAFGLKSDYTGGSATISSSLYLLVKFEHVIQNYGYDAPRFFICNSDTESTEFKLAKYGARRKKLTDLWDFGPEPAKHYSYSYHIPYDSYPPNTATSEPGKAVVAERNPWLDPFIDTTGFKWNDQTKTGPPEDIKRSQKGNNGFHQREGQNVLFMDNHVYFEKHSFCGVNDDNIYTYWDGSDIRQGAPPVMGSHPADRLDSLLVNEQPKKDKQ
jgi:hypothetical protein